MIAHGLHGLASNNADVTVIGAGPAGITLALECARIGKSVLLLESGAKGGSRDAQQLSGAQIIDVNSHYEMAVCVSRRFGGASNLWGARCQPLDPIDFSARPGLTEAKWPIAFEELLPFYAAACSYASCGEPAFTAAAMHDALHDRAQVDTHRLERFSNRPKFQRAHKTSLSSPRIDVRLNATVIGFALRENGAIGEIVVSRSGRERITIPVREVVIACGGLESTRLLLTIQREHPEIFGGTGGPLGRYYMAHLVGDIANITFASDNHVDAFGFLLDGNGSYVRRRMILSDEVQRENKLLNCAFWPIVMPVSDASHGSGISSLAYLTVALGPLARRVLPEAIRMRHLRPDVAWTRHLENAMRDLPRIAAFLPKFAYQRYVATARLPGFFVKNRMRRYGLAYHQEQLSDRSSRVWLNRDTDRLGVPRLSVCLKFDRRNAESLVRSHRLLQKWLDRTSVGTLHYRYPNEELEDTVLARARHGTHQIGTARMGLDRRDAVVDRSLRTFDVPNLHVLSSAVMPTSGQAGPTLTIIALAVKLARDLGQTLTA
ncbi:GMC family oxidoreductase [Bradyrhizobium sp. 44]|uniref:FAD-dependent oxidoreductase n=1 Tax=Bradyrhizobium sp. 44 TaxID=2782675 RepID=UPI001FF75B13|nr:FAD-dependent oxidoreductase [Bradyrhizobium sp. 44]MCK1288976.1 GMC family oxidoreductase [Bradyrhizobium sp. 44]